jgi:splicing factor U2AF 65 kDa subunit
LIFNKGRPILPIEILGANGFKAAEPTSVLMMANVFEPELIAKDDVYEDVLEDIRLECERFGTVVEVYIPRPEKDDQVFLSGRVFIN